MKNKIALPMLLLLALGVVACSPSETTTTTSTSTSSETSETSSSVPTSTTPTEELVEIYNYDFDASDLVDMPALPSIDEGMGIVVKEGGYATTIKDAEKTEGAAPSWTFASEGYDKDVASFEIKTKTKAVSADVDPALATQVSVVRVAYDWAMDVQVNFKNSEEGWSGIKVYNTNGTELASTEELTLNLDTYYEITIRAILLEDESSMHFSVAVDGTNVIDIEKTVWKIDRNAKHCLGASEGSHINWDYFKLSRVVNGK